MSKAVMISVQPKWCQLIESGKKTIELRKSNPKLKTPFKCYIYCTKDNIDASPSKIWWRADKTGFRHIMNGKVIGEFVCDWILGHCEMANADIAERGSWVRRDKIFQYANGKEVFGWHISDLLIYDKPKELCEFYKNGTLGNEAFCESVYDGNRSYADYLFAHALRKPPQSWCYVEELGGAS